MKIWMLSLALMLGISQDNWEKHKIEDVTVSLPEQFKQLSDEEVVKRYGMHRIPLAIFVAEDEFINLSINKKVDTVSFNPPVDYKNVTDRRRQADMDLEKSFVKSSIYNTFSDIDFKKDTAYFSENMKEYYVHFEFEGYLEGVDNKSQPVKTRTYNYVYYLMKKNETFIFNFGCPERFQATWQPIARRIMTEAKVR